MVESGTVGSEPRVDRLPRLPRDPLRRPRRRVFFPSLAGFSSFRLEEARGCPCHGWSAACDPGPSPFSGGPAAPRSSRAGHPVRGSGRTSRSRRFRSPRSTRGGRKPGSPRASRRPPRSRAAVRPGCEGSRTVLPAPWHAPRSRRPGRSRRPRWCPSEPAWPPRAAPAALPWSACRARRRGPGTPGSGPSPRLPRRREPFPACRAARAGPGCGRAGPRGWRDLLVSRA